MYSRTALGTVFTLAMVLTPPAVSAQQPTQPQQPTPEVQQWIEEIQKLEAELAPLHEKAMEDSALQQQRDELESAVREAMVKADPENGQRLDRLEELMTEAQAAQAAGDTAKIAALTTEAQPLVPQVQAAQQQAMATPEVEAHVEAFEEKLFAKMVEMDPAAQQRIDRLNELSRRIEAAMGRGGD